MLRVSNSFILGFFPPEAFVSENTKEQDFELLSLDRSKKVPEKEASQQQVAKSQDKIVSNMPKEGEPQIIQEVKPLVTEKDEPVLNESFKDGNMKYDPNFLFAVPTSPVKPNKTVPAAQARKTDVVIQEREKDDDWEEVFDFDDVDKNDWQQSNKPGT